MTSRYQAAAYTLLISIIILATGCSVQTSSLFPPQPGELTRSIFLINHGLHAGIAIKRKDLQQSSWPKLHEFSDVDYLEIGWGDRDYYTSSDPGLGLAAKAIILPTSSVLHVVGFNGSPTHYFPHSEIIRIELSVSGFEQMMRKISKSFSIDDYGSAIQLGPGKYGNSWFYASGETYHLCKTCNSWTATILQAAGCPITPTATVKGLMSQARALGEIIQEKAEHPHH